VCLKGLAAAVLLCGGVPCHAAESQIVLLYNTAHVAPEVTIQAKDQASRILREAGILLQWADCSPDLHGQLADPRCAEFFSKRSLIVHMAASAGQFPNKKSLAYSVVDRSGGNQTVVFLDRVAKFTTESKPLFGLGQVLGHVMAHEMGHLLLSLVDHTPKGIMKACWGPKELQQIADGELLFTPLEAAKMQEKLRRRASSNPADRNR